MLDSVPDEWGPKFEHDGSAITYTHTGPNSIRLTAGSHMALVMFTVQPGREIALGSDRRSVGTAPVGALEIVPASAELYARWTVEKQNLLVAADPDRLKRLAGMEFDNETFELRPQKFGFVDDKARLLAQMIRQEMLDPLLHGQQSIEALNTLFLIHLLRNYSSLRSRQTPSPSGGLPPATWRRVNDFVQANLAGHLSLEQLALVAQLSPSHFARAFRQTTGQSPYQYVISARLQYARRMIVTTDVPVGHIAKAAGFSSNSHMTALMRRIWGTTPIAYRRNYARNDATDPSAATDEETDSR